MSAYNYEPSNREKRKNCGKQDRMRDDFNNEKVRGMKKRNKKRYIRNDED